VLATALTLVAGLALAASSNFVVGVLTDERGTPPFEALATGAQYFTESARLNARLAQYEFRGDDRNLALALFYVRRAVVLSPWNYAYRLQLASVEEASGNREAAEGSLRSALALAPNNGDVHWRMANLLLRLGRAPEATVEFRKATTANSSLLGAALDLTWRSSGGEVDRVEAVTGDDPRSRLILSQFLVRQSRIPEAASIFSSVDRQQRLRSPEASAFLHMLIDSARWATAHNLWLDTVSGNAGPRDGGRSLIWNGGFEREAVSNLPEFDWKLSSSQYARIAISSDVAHSGSRSLRIDFAGLDTTRIDGEVKQLVSIKPGHRYRLECYVKSDELHTPEGPRLAVLDARSSNEIVTSGPVPAGSSEWTIISSEFLAQPDCEAVFIEIRRLPRFSYDDPTRGTVWFDDFALMESGVSQ